ncbi:MAG: hypothetical protein BWY91_03243 [bacterium ADurb.BinA028]|nr:MAG: hypothetical protein BWY91_03243 [bacterium ADurb.BinA028]
MADVVPHTAADGTEVVGRRAPIRATCSPTMALNRDDLPLPVAPARATTVWPPAIDVRSRTLSTRLTAWSTWAGSSSRAPSVQACDSAAARSANSAAVTTVTVALPIRNGLIERL